MKKQIEKTEATISTLVVDCNLNVENNYILTSTDVRGVIDMKAYLDHMTSDGKITALVACVYGDKFVRETYMGGDDWTFYTMKYGTTVKIEFHQK